MEEPPPDPTHRQRGAGATSGRTAMLPIVATLGLLGVAATPHGVCRGYGSRLSSRISTLEATVSVMPLSNVHVRLQAS